MPYQLKTDRFAENPSIMLVGCGGTGGFVAEGLCRLFSGRECRLHLVDHDRVEPHNLLRQNFNSTEVGEYKSKALAHRLAAQFDRPIKYSTERYNLKNARHLTKDRSSSSLTIACVDNASARADMNNSIERYQRQWLIDAGNGFNWGQVLIGNIREPAELAGGFTNNTCSRLPSPVLQRPDILSADPGTAPDMDCAAAMDLADQDPTINEMMAAWVVHIVRRMAANNCPFMAINVDLELGTVLPTYATPDNVAKATGTDPSDLIATEHQGD